MKEEPQPRGFVISVLRHPTSSIAEAGYAQRMTAIVKGLSDACPSLGSAARSVGRRLISLEGGNRGPACAQRCGALELWGFESRGQSAARWAW